MKVLALNSSPRTGSVSKTELMLTQLLKGMKDAGAQVELVELRKKKVKDCVGCFTCWTKTPGICVHKDDMTEELYPKWLESDLAVYATPLYHFLMNAVMKAFIERTLPILEPYLITQQGRTFHPMRARHPKLVLLSVAGFPEMTVFDQLSFWIRSIYGNHGLVAAEIYRPMAEALLVPTFAEKTKEILDATRRAGREIVENGSVSPKTMEKITQPLVKETGPSFEIANLMWKTCIAEGVTPREFGEKGMIPRPDSIESFMMIMPMGFNSDKAGDTKAVIQFNFTESKEGSCHFRIENGAVQTFAGPASDPDLTIETPFELWMDIMTGKANGQEMFMSQAYGVKGDLGLLIKMSQLFGGSVAGSPSS